MNSGWYDTYIHISCKHQLLLNFLVRKSGWSLEAYIHIYHCHHFYHHHDKHQYLKRYSVWSLETYIHLYHCHQYDKIHYFNSKSGWSQETYIHVVHCPQILQYFLNKKYHHYYDGGRMNGWSLEIDGQDFHNHSS